MTISRHAALRYRERVKPHLTLRQASQELLRLLGGLSGAPEAPPWVLNDRRAAHGESYVILSDGICAVTLGDFVVTVVIRTGRKRNRYHDGDKFPVKRQLSGKGETR